MDDFLRIDDVTLGQWAGQLQVCEDGYDLSTEARPMPVAHHLHGPWLVPRGDWSLSVLIMSRRSPSNLHRRFSEIGRANVQLQTKKVLAFANNWGLLNDSRQDNRNRTNYVLILDDRTNPLVPGENLHTWFHRAEMVAAWLLWWDMLSNDPEKLRPFILWDPNSESLRFFFGFDGRRLTTDRSFHQRYRTLTTSDGKGTDEWAAVADGRARSGKRVFKLFPELYGERFDIERAARLVLYRQIESELAGNVRVGLDMQREPARALISYPSGLWGAIWLHFAREVMGKTAALQPCANPQCDNTFKPSPRRQFCRDACRITSFRAERRAAIITPTLTPTAVDDDGRT